MISLVYRIQSIVIALFECRDQPQTTLLTRKHGIADIAPCYYLLLGFVAFALSLQLKSQEPQRKTATESFFATIDPSKTSGHIDFIRLNSGLGIANSKNHIVTTLTWSNGNVRSDLAMLKDGDNGNGTAGKVFLTRANCGSTNWEFRNGALTIYARPSPTGMERDAALAGRTPEQYELEVILGRGLLLSNFLSSWNGTMFAGHLASGIPIVGVMESHAETNHFHWQYTAPSAKELGAFLNDVQLMQFQDGYIPSRLTTWHITERETNLWADYRVIGSGPAEVSFEPSKVGRITKILTIDRGHLLPPRQPVLGSVTEIASRKAIRMKPIFLLLIVVLVFTVPVVFYRLRHNRNITN